MKAASFEYHAPASLEEAAGLLATLGDVKVLAGGQSLVPMLALRIARYDHLVDLNRIPELSGITLEGDTCIVGAMTRQAVAGSSEVVERSVPLLHRAIPLIGHFQIRNRGTIGGSLAHADSASELPSVALALGATFEGHSTRGPRRIAAREFFVSRWETALEEDEILARVHFPVRRPHSGFAIEELAWRSGDFAIAGAAVAVCLDGSGVIADSGIALFGVGRTPLFAESAVAALRGFRPGEIDLAGIAALAESASEPIDDVHATAEYRRKITRTLVRHALERALEEATHG